jgi:hypothetical protein
MSQKLFLQLAKDWAAAGRSDAKLLDSHWQLLALRCWVGGLPNTPKAVDPLIAEFCAASVARRDALAPGWYDRLLSLRDCCERCGETYRVENLAVCSQCLSTWCHRCLNQPKAANGYRLHSCGGEFVG